LRIGLAENPKLNGGRANVMDRRQVFISQGIRAVMAMESAWMGVGASENDIVSYENGLANNTDRSSLSPLGERVACRRRFSAGAGRVRGSSPCSQLGMNCAPLLSFCC